jgi:histidinol-phosphate aminotransferase
MAQTLTRRALGRLLGATAGATLLDARIASTLTALPANGAKGPIRLSANENPYGPCAASLAALGRCGADASRYPGAIEEEVRSALAKQHGVDPSQIVLGCGSSDVLRMADSAFVPEGARIVAAEPTFEAVLNYAKVTRADVAKVPLTADYRHDLPGMRTACDAQTAMIYICNPNNPTGTVVDHEQLDAFIKSLPPTCVVLIDEAYHHFAEDPRYKSALELAARRDNVVVTRTFSKIYGMAGMRLGYGVASAANAELLRRHASWDNTSQAALAMGLASLSDPSVVPTQRRLLNQTRKWLCDELARDGRRFIPSEANFVMIDVGGDIVPVREAMRERGIQTGRKFPSMPNWLRVSIGKPEEMEAFLAAFRDVVPKRAAA